MVVGARLRLWPEAGQHCRAHLARQGSKCRFQLAPGGPSGTSGAGTRAEQLTFGAQRALTEFGAPEAQPQGGVQGGQKPRAPQPPRR
eukprot:3884534-Alexandrium_andersonii.AAC.1